MQQDVEALCGSTMGTPSMHREAGTEPHPSVCLCGCLCVWVGAGLGVFFMHCVVALACSVASSESLAFGRENHPDSQVYQIPEQWYPLGLTLHFP